MDGLVALLTLVETIQVAFYLPAIAWVVVGFWLGLGVAEVRLGVGPRMFGVRIGDTIVGLRLLPLGCRVSWTETGPRSIYILSGALRAILYLSGPLLCALAGYAILGSDAQASFLATFPQYLAGSISPAAASTTWMWLLQQDPVSCAGHAAMKTAAINLLPLPPLPGGLALVEGLAPTGPEGAAPWKVWFLNLSVAALFLSLASWAIGLAWALWTLA